MKKKKITKILPVLLLFSLILTTGIGSISYAAADDPGAGRLSGDNISEDFYSNDAYPGFSPKIRRYGGFTSTSPYTNKTYTHRDVFSGRSIVNGIDVSQYQKEIDWAKVKAAGIDFAFIRVGYRGYGSAGTLNASTKDSYFDKNMQNAIAAGVKVGVYIFSQAITPEEAREEAQYILNNLGNYNVSMPLIMDYEYASDASDGGRVKKAKLSKTQATNICLAFCETIAAAGYTPMVYANASMLEDQLNASAISANYRIWLANYTTSTSYSGIFDFWQYSSTGKVNGISGNVDMNFYYTQPGDNFMPHVSSISTASIASVANQPYTGKNVTPALSVTHNGVPLTQNVDYTVSYSSNKNIGTATAKITGIGSWRDTKSITFNIVPKTMSAVKAKKRSTSYITLSWNKDNNATGYQIYRAASLNGTYKKIKTISKKTTTSYKNTKLSKGTCYYYKIRAYKKTDGKTFYGAFSSVKSLYTQMGYTRLALGKSGAVIYDTASTSGNVVLHPTVNIPMTVSYSTKDANGSTWYYVTYKTTDIGYKGFVRSNMVTIGKQGKINGKKVNVRKSYTTKSKKLTQLSKNKKVTVLTTKTKKGVRWYKVTFKKGSKTYTGWISAPYVKIN